MVDGILNLDKPGGLTSHDVVNRVRALVGQRQVGHAGTLDPMATGVLVICLGRATRLSEYAAASRKSYRARVRLGVVTDTYDADGCTVAEAPVVVDGDAVERALAGFRGPIVQLAPAYSAIKRAGQPLYKLARRGVEVERPARSLEIFELTLIECSLPECVLEVTCSAGTYVRVLAHDLGQALGCGAHLAGLTRLASGDFRLEDAVGLEVLQRAGADRWQDWLLPLDRAVARFPALHLNASAAQRLLHGHAVDGPAPDAAGAPAGSEPLARAYGPSGAFLALVVFAPRSGGWQPHKVLSEPED